MYISSKTSYCVFGATSGNKFPLSKHNRDQHYPNLFIVGHSLDVGTCCNQSNVRRRNLG